MRRDGAGETPRRFAMNWYQEIKVPRKSKRIAKRIERAANGARERRVRIKKPEDLYRNKTIGRYVYNNGVRIRLYSVGDVAKHLGIHTLTVRSWFKDGYMPDPYLQTNTDRGEEPLWLAMQIVALCKVVNQLYRQGYANIPWKRLPDHVDMVKDGGDDAVERFNRKTFAQRDNESYDKFGVIIDD